MNKSLLKIILILLVAMVNLNAQDYDAKFNKIVEKFKLQLKQVTQTPNSSKDLDSLKLKVTLQMNEVAKLAKKKAQNEYNASIEANEATKRAELEKNDIQFDYDKAIAALTIQNNLRKNDTDLNNKLNKRYTEIILNRDATQDDLHKARLQDIADYKDSNAYS